MLNDATVLYSGPEGFNIDSISSNFVKLMVSLIANFSQNLVDRFIMGSLSLAIVIWG
jgi:hypothetical protein